MRNPGEHICFFARCTQHRPRRGVTTIPSAGLSAPAFDLAHGADVTALSEMVKTVSAP
jgi:hypothetical protein